MLNSKLEWMQSYVCRQKEMQDYSVGEASGIDGNTSIDSCNDYSEHYLNPKPKPGEVLVELGPLQPQEAAKLPSIHGLSTLLWARDTYNGFATSAAQDRKYPQ